MSDYKELIAEAREFASWIEPSQGATSDLMLRLADALEAASRELAFERLRKVDEQIEDAEWRAVVEAQALEALADKYAWASSVRVADIRAHAAEIREGRA